MYYQIAHKILQRKQIYHPYLNNFRVMVKINNRTLAIAVDKSMTNPYSIAIAMQSD